MNFSMAKDVKWSHGAAIATAATSDVDTAVLDMKGYDGFVAIVSTGDVTTASELRLTLFGNTASSTTDPVPVAVLLTAQFVAGDATADSKVLVADCPKWNPAYRYAFCRVERDTANAVIASVVLGQYHARSLPVTQVDAVISGFAAN